MTNNVCPRSGTPISISSEETVENDQRSICYTDFSKLLFKSLTPNDHIARTVYLTTIVYFGGDLKRTKEISEFLSLSDEAVHRAKERIKYKAKDLASAFDKIPEMQRKK